MGLCDIVKLSNEKVDVDYHQTPLFSQLEINSIIDSIYEKYRHRLQQFLLSRLRSKEDADDVTQEVYLRLSTANTVPRARISILPAVTTKGRSGL